MRHSSPTRAAAPGRARRRLLVTGLTLTVCAFVAPVVGALPAQATTYPSWADVQAAKGNQAATQAEVAKVQDALKGLQSVAAQKSAAALTASAQAAAAESDLRAATQTADDLTARAAAAAETAARAKDRAGQLAAHLYRSGDSDTITSRIVGSKKPQDLLYQLGTLDQLSDTWAGVMSDASVAANTATSLHDQAQRAEAERQRLADAAETKSTAADAAEAAANAAVSSTQQHSDELYAQLATLKDTTAKVERQYAIGQAVAAQVAAQKRAAQLAAERAAAQRATSAVAAAAPTTSYPDPSGVAADPAGAQAYARGAIGAYGWGSDQFSCLVSLWTQESGWRANALNVSSGAYGIPQALPASKMATAGADWRTNQDTQINWGLAYIKDAYGSPCAAWNHEMSENPHWY
ncbi:MULTISPECIES: hypothetical protein [unclassified Curtobacterium]|uniref:coiled-coil domain-containing protein n=1 Tax=unclassified Curtobacterium TaxID=257496 RepID=UPI0021ABE9A4|nr:MULTISPECIES: hypothetical protein [unclassified Curtobacterium]